MDEYAKLKIKLQLGKNSNLNYIQEKDIDNIEEKKKKYQRNKC